MGKATLATVLLRVNHVAIAQLCHVALWASTWKDAIRRGPVPHPHAARAERRSVVSPIAAGRRAVGRNAARQFRPYQGTDRARIRPSVEAPVAPARDE